MTGSLRGDIPPVVRLGHDLVRNFEALPADQAAVEIATHIRKFWEPRMRRQLWAHLAATQGEDLLPVVRDAMRAHPELA